MTSLPAIVTTTGPPVAHADTDQQLVGLWLFGRPRTTTTAYKADLSSFQVFTGGQPLRWLTLGTLQAWVISMQEAGLAARTISRRTSCIKSLFSFGSKLGYMPFNVAGALKTPPVPSEITPRHLTMPQVVAMTLAVKRPRDRLLLKALYSSGCRCSEIITLRWGMATQTMDGNMSFDVLGKGGKSRRIIFRAEFWNELLQVKGDATDSDAIFRSQIGGKPMSAAAVARVVSKAATAAGIGKKVSPHWLRHAFATHSLEKGVALPLVSKSLGHANLAVTGRYLHSVETDFAGLSLEI